MLKFAIAGAVLVFGRVERAGVRRPGPPRNASIARCRRSTTAKRSSRKSAASSVRCQRSSDRRSRRDRTARRPAPAHAAIAPIAAPRRKYDSQEVVKKVRNVDQSRVINTRTVVPVGTRVKETNHLVIHQERDPPRPAWSSTITSSSKKKCATSGASRCATTRRIRHAQLSRRGAAGHHHGAGDAAPANGCYRGRGYVGYGSCRSVASRSRIIRALARSASGATPAAGTNGACRRGSRRSFRFPESSAGTAARSSPRPPPPSAMSSGPRPAPPPRASASASGPARAG